MFYVRLPVDHLYEKSLFTWQSLLLSLVVSYLVLSFFSRDVFGEVWDWIESVPETFPSYSSIWPHSNNIKMQ